MPNTPPLIYRQQFVFCAPKNAKRKGDGLPSPNLTDLLLHRELFPILHVRGVKELFGFLGAVAPEVILIKTDDVGVIVRLANALLLVDRVEDVRPFLAIGVEDRLIAIGEEGRLDERLTAAIDAATRAAHDFDEGVGRLPRPDCIE